MEQLLNTERFYLSRLYYFEMKDELEAALKQQQFRCSGKYEKERLNQAWKHHAEVGELYQRLLEKEVESLEEIEDVKRPEGTNIPEKGGDIPGTGNIVDRENIPVRRSIPDRGYTPEGGNIPAGAHITETSAEQ